MFGYFLPGGDGGMEKREPIDSQCPSRSFGLKHTFTEPDGICKECGRKLLRPEPNKTKLAGRDDTPQPVKRARLPVPRAYWEEYRTLLSTGLSDEKAQHMIAQRLGLPELPENVYWTVQEALSLLFVAYLSTQEGDD